MSVQRYRPLKELVPVHWQSGTVEAADGLTIHFTRTGRDKPSVVLLHGIQAAGLMWLRTAQALEADYDVVMPDFRGHGQTGGIECGFSIDLLVEDTAALIRTLKLDRPVVVGHSMGADIAGRFAAAHTDLLRGVVLVDPALRNIVAAIPADAPWMQALFEAMRALKTQPHAERMVTALRLLPPGTPAWDEADYVSFVDGMAQFDPATFQYAMKMDYLVESPETIRQITCPALLLTARPMMPGMSIAEGVAMFQSNWHDGWHVHFDDSGHFIPFDQFARFLEVLRNFVRDV